jgi:hypothetical protein
LKICSGAYIKRGTLESVMSHPPIVFDENAAMEGACPLCYEKAWHEDTAKTLRATEDKVGSLLSIFSENRMEHLLP